jgi:excisionase family DNA binding protein
MGYNTGMISNEDLTGKLYTPTEAAKILKVGYFNIYNRLKRGEIEASQVGRKWLIPERAIIAYLNRKK